MKRFALTLVTLLAALPLFAAGWGDRDTGYWWTFRILDSRCADIRTDKDGVYEPAITPKPTGSIMVPFMVGDVKFNYNRAVTSLGYCAFFQCTDLRSATVHDGVTEIGMGAFNTCTGLRTVTIGRSVRSIGDYAFQKCYALQSITFLGDAPEVGVDAFDNVPSTCTVYVQKESTGWGDVPGVWNGLNVKYDDTSFSEETIGSAKWSYRIKGEMAEVYPGAYDLGYGKKWALYDRANGAAVTIPSVLGGKPVTSIGYRSFFEYGDNYGSREYYVIIPDGVMSIGREAFLNSKLETVSLPDSLVHIGARAFMYCQRLAHVTIPDVVKCIGDEAFYHCEGLKSVTFLGDAPEVGEDAFSNVNAACKVYVQRGSKGWGVSIPGKWKGLDIDYASVSSGTSGGNTWSYRTVDNGTVELDSGAGTAAISPSPTGKVKIPMTLNGDYVVRIGRNAFRVCSEMTGVEISDWGFVGEIGRYAFRDCTGLTSLTMPATIKSIASYAFYGCSSLKSITFNGNAPEVGKDAFKGLPSDCVVYVKNKESTGWGVDIPGKWKGLDIMYEGNMTEEVDGYTWWYFIQDGTAHICYGTERTQAVSPYPEGVAITMPSTLGGKPVTEIGDYALATDMIQAGPSSVNIPDTVTRIGNYALAGCGFENIAIPNGVTNIGENAFADCIKLKSVTIPSGVTSIGNYAFNNCRGLKSVTFTGNAPDADSSIFIGVPSDCIVYVPNNSTWAEALAAETWNGRNIVCVNTIDLSSLTENTVVQDGATLTGTLGGNYKISIADGATVTLSDVNISGVNNSAYSWAGITCEGDATIVLEGANAVEGFYEDYPGIHVPEGKTLTIKGAGSLDASSNGWGAGIGGGYNISCGNIAIDGGYITAIGGSCTTGIGCGFNTTGGGITISGGSVTAVGGANAAGIGSSQYGECSNITINGGTITATGDKYAAGIGSGRFGICGNITIADGVSSLTATKGEDSPNSIGAGLYGTCGTVTIGGVEGAVAESPYTFPKAGYKVTFDTDGGFAIEDSVVAIYGENLPAITVPTKTGYAFGGYFDEPNGKGTKYYYSSGKGAKKWDKTADTTLYAKWTLVKYTITLDGQGADTAGTASVSAAVGATLPAITVPVKAGYTFGGYFAEPNGQGTKYYYSSGKGAAKWDKAEAATLYAKWAANKYKVALNGNGATGDGTASVNAVYGADMPKITKPTRTGYIFAGYFANKDGSGDKYYNADGTSAKVWDVDSAVTLYARWVSASTKFKVTLDNQDATTAGTASVKVAFDNALPQIEIPTKTGYAFGGYFDGKDGTGTKYYYSSGKGAQKWDKPANTTLYAKWTPIKYKISFNRQGATVKGTDSVTAVYGEALPQIEVPTKVGYTFGGYFEEPNGKGVKYYYSSGRGAVKWDKLKGATLYARWTTAKYTITLNNQGATTKGTTSVTATYGAALPAITVPTKTGYTFSGYFAEPNGKGTKYYYSSGKGAVKWDKGEATTLYARWTKAKTVAKLAAKLGNKATQDEADKPTFMIENGVLLEVIPNGLTEIEVPDTVIEIGEAAFVGCTEVERVVLPETVEVIGEFAFFGCAALEELVLPTGELEVSDTAFIGCQGLADDSGTITIDGIPFDCRNPLE